MAVKKEIVKAGFHEALGILLLALCALGILSLFSFDPGDIALLQSPPNAPPTNFIGPAGAWFGFLTFMAFGVSGYLLPAALAYLGLICILKREGRIWPKALWLLAFLVTICCLMELSGGAWSALRARLNTVGAGGVIGDLVARRLLVSLMGAVGTGIFSVALMLVSLTMLFEVHPVAAGRAVSGWFAAMYEKFEEKRKGRLDRIEQLEEQARDVAKKKTRLERAVKTFERATSLQEAASVSEPAPAPPPARRTEPRTETAPAPEREPAPLAPAPPPAE
jgi:S-DNA-T family DNA segregation ATPase FtsK/SpoIIIE